MKQRRSVAVKTGSGALTSANSSRRSCGNVGFCRQQLAKAPAELSAILHVVAGCYLRLRPPCTYMWASLGLIHIYVSDSETWLLRTIRSTQCRAKQQPSATGGLQIKSVNQATNPWRTPFLGVEIHFSDTIDSECICVCHFRKWSLITRP